MLRSAAAVMLLILLATACTDAAGDDPEPTTTASAPEQDVTTTGAPTSTGAVTTTVAGATTTTAAPQDSTTTSTTGVPDTTGGSGSSVEFLCLDLYRADDAEEVEDVMLASWHAGGEALWEIPLGTVQPVWAVAGDEVILGFGDGTLAGVDVATCTGWEISLTEGIDELAVTATGMIIAVHGGSISAFTGRGVAAWRHASADGGYRFAGENNGIAVFVDQFGDMVGIDAAGDVVFEWGGASDLATVAVSETFVYRATGAEVAARPVAGGDVVWAEELTGIEALFTAPGLLLAQDEDSLHALVAGSGEVVWSIPFDGDIAPPAVVEHGELHLAARHSNVWFDTLWHLDPADGTTIVRSTAPPNTEWFPEMDDALLLQVGEDGRVTAIDMQQRVAWVVETGAIRIGRFTQAEIAPGGVVVTLTFSAERF